MPGATVRSPLTFTVLAAVACFATMPLSILAQETVVIPAVSDNTPGINGSIWATEVQVIKKNPEDALTVRRLWVCVPEGGFLEDPDTALTWELPNPRPADRILTLLGENLLEGTDSSLGAVALVIEGGEAIVNARVGDVSRGEWVGMTPFGQGQRVPSDLGPSTGPSHLPWVGGCRSAPCNLVPPLNWDYFRNNIGIVNPNPEQLTVNGLAIPFGPDTGDVPIELEMADDRIETFSKTVEPYGWSQFAWVASRHYDFNIWGQPLIPIAGFVITLDPDLPIDYFAYVSTVFAPDPDSGVPAFNDPMFIPAEPGAVEPYRSDP